MSGSPSPDSNCELEEDLRTFEEKYRIIDNQPILGEGCSSVVKICVMRQADKKASIVSDQAHGRRVFKKHESSPLLHNILSKLSPNPNP